MNEMTSLERVLATMTHKKPDRVPVFPILLMQGAAELGMGLEQYFSRGVNWAEGQLKLRDKFGHDCVVGVPHIVQDITAFGAKVMYWKNGPPSPGSMVIHSWKDAVQLTVPDPSAVPELVESLKAIELLAKEVKGETLIIGAAIAPFSLPSMLMGTEKWMDLLLFEEDAVREEVMGHMLETTLEFCVAWSNAQLAAGADAIVLADGISSAAVLTRQQFIDFALPTVKAVVPRIEGFVVHEGVGHLHPMLDLLVDIGLIGVVLSHLDDLAVCKEIVGDKLALIGNLNNIEMIRWSPEEMTQKCQAALEAMSCAGFVLSAQGPDIPLGISDETIHAMVQAPRNWQC
ncbi:MAG: hypothetical protein GY803_24120 [Chloroflexi bacterium]|nr:hypothetical protein [Chloroflexota bacterium]